MIKIRVKMRNRSRRYDIIRTRSKHEHKYTKYKMCHSMVIICNKRHLSSICGWAPEKVKQHWGWVEKKCCLWRKACILNCDSDKDKTNFVDTMYAWSLCPAIITPIQIIVTSKTLLVYDYF